MVTEEVRKNVCHMKCSRTPADARESSEPPVPLDSEKVVPVLLQCASKLPNIIVF